MAPLIVDLLEVVEIHDRHRELLVECTVQHHLDLLLGSAVVQQTGKAVVGGPVLQLDHPGPLIVDVQHLADHAGILGRILL